MLFLQRGERIPAEEENVPETSWCWEVEEGMGLQMDGWLVSFCSIGQSSTGQGCGHGLPSLLDGICTRQVGRAHRVSLFQFTGFSLVDGKVCDFPRRGVAEKQKESKCAADGQASSSSGRA